VSQETILKSPKSKNSGGTLEEKKEKPLVGHAQNVWQMPRILAGRRERVLFEGLVKEMGEMSLVFGGSGMRGAGLFTWDRVYGTYI